MALRHKINTNKTGEIFQSGDLKIDFSNRTVLKNGKEVKLTPTEYSILLILIKSAKIKNLRVQVSSFHIHTG